MAIYEKKLSIKLWAEEDRPREKLMLKGRSALSDSELVALLISSGNSRLSVVELSKAILNSVDNNLNNLARLTINNLMRFNALEIVALVLHEFGHAIHQYSSGVDGELLADG